MRRFPILATVALLVAAGPAFAQASPEATPPPAAATQVAAGQTVYDAAGGIVGKVDKVEGGVAVVATGKNNAGLPLSAFAMGPNGPVISMTRDQVDAAAAGEAAKTAAAVTAGAAVKDTSGATVGTIKAVEGEYALLDTAKVQVRLPLTAFAAQPSGLVVGMSKAQIEAAASAATPATK